MKELNNRVVTKAVEQYLSSITPWKVGDPDKLVSEKIAEILGVEPAQLEPFSNLIDTIIVRCLNNKIRSANAPGR